MKKYKLIGKQILIFTLTMTIVLTLMPTSISAEAEEPANFPYDLGDADWNSDDGVLKSWTEPWVASVAEVIVIEYQNQLSGDYNFIIDLLGEHLLFGNWDMGEGKITQADGKITLDMRGLASIGNIMFGFLNPSDWENVTRIYLDIISADNSVVNQSPKVIFVDANNTNDGDGTKANPFRYLTHAVQAANPSDVILVEDGIYYGAITIPSGTKNMPTIVKAAAGARPVITPTIPFEANWSLHSGNIYVANVGNENHRMDTEFPQLFVDGVSMIEARYPNLPGTDMTTALEQEMLIAQAGTDLNNIVLPEVLPFDITGATVILWPGDGAVTGWQADTSRISSVSGNTARLADPIGAELDPNMHTWENDKHPFPGNPFFLVGALSLLDSPGEYYYDTDANMLYFYAPNGESPETLNLSLKSNERFAVRTSSYTMLDGFHIYGGGIDAGGKDITIQNCIVRYADHFNLKIGEFAHRYGGVSGVIVSGMNITVKNCIIGPTAGSGITTGGIGNTITDNFIHDVAYAGQWYAGITAFGLNEGLEISHNSIHNSGRDLIYFFTNSVGDGPDDSFAGSAIRNNHLKNPMIFASDGGAIFMGGTDGGGTAEFYYNFVEVGDIRMHGLWEVAIKGIYFEGGDNYIIRNNISVGEGSGMSMNLPHEGIQVYNNTVIGARIGFAMCGHLHYGTEGVGFVLKDNLFVDTKVTDVRYSDIMGITKIIDGTFDENGSFPFTYLERDGMTVSGNGRGAVDEQFLPVGDTPNVGAVLRGEDMFEYGTTWDIGNQPSSDGIIADYFDSNQSSQIIPDTPDNEDTELPIIDNEDTKLPNTEDEVNRNIIQWIIIGTSGAAMLVIIAIVIKTKTAKK
ncbi:MAG: hypothetical protein LBD23_20755 [Oscillospiraceae bacterium]|jgi:hypothetical protein|nr:hypothetical protein [Oscillospiraceae bacterium]